MEAALPLVQYYYGNQSSMQHFTESLRSKITRIENTPLSVLQPPPLDNSNNRAPERVTPRHRPLTFIISLAKLFLVGEVLRYSFKKLEEALYESHHSICTPKRKRTIKIAGVGIIVLIIIGDVVTVGILTLL